MKENLSKRGQSLVKDLSPLMQAHYNIQEDLYHPVNHPQGYINMGTAEAHIINDEILGLLHTIHGRLQLESKHIHYDYFHGSVEFREAVAEYWQRIIFGENSSRRISPDNIVAGAGCSLALEMLATMLGDHGDVVLVPAPYYSGFEDDFTHRAGVELAGVHCGSELDRSAFEAALAQQKALGKRVCAVLFSSPNNPVGTVYNAEAVKGLISFCMENNLDIVSDEIYAQTIHSPTTQWHSTLSLVPDEWLHRTHVTSSFAKDFALSGFRTGFAISFNEDLVKGMRGLAYYSCVSTHTQAVLSQLLRAPELPDVLRIYRTKLRTAWEVIEESFDEMEIEILPAQGGIFVFANFAPYMDQMVFEEEYTLWEKIYKELRINISPGQLFDAATPGWFRVCFAHDAKVVKEACTRLKTLKRLR